MVTLLVVDDMEFMRNLLNVILEEASDMRVVATGNNGTEGVSLYKEHDPDVVLMNIRMPIQDGISATDDITDYDPDATVIICSGNRQEAKMREAIEAGASDYVTKPFQKEALLDVIHDNVS
jgi:two-component system chemotaxis response regulator CheY